MIGRGYDNKVGNIRPNCTFESYVPKTDTQNRAKMTMDQLADGLIGLKGKFYQSSNPFAAGAFFVLSGGPGRGKSHLLEALVRKVSEEAPDVVEQMFLLRKNFTHHTIASIDGHTFENCPIILIDDLFSDHPSLSSLHPATDIECLSRFIAYAYENRCLVIATCNFPFLDGILPLIAKEDRVGRITSRCQELLTANANEFVMDGPDHREEMAREAEKRRKNGASTNFSIQFLDLK